MVNLINHNLSVICQVSHEVHNANILYANKTRAFFVCSNIKVTG